MREQDDPYAALGVPPSASQAEITSAYRRLVRALHPDTHPGDADAAARLSRVTAAYRVLVEPGRRDGRDRSRPRAGTAQAPAPGQPIPVTVLGRTTVDPVRPSEASWRTGESWRASEARPAPGRGPDATAEVTLELADAVRGVMVTVETADGAVPARRVHVPAGVTDGQRLRVPGAGDPGRGGPGDLYLLLRVRDDPRVRRSGDDLAVTVPVTFPEAAAGARLTVPVLGESVAVEVPAGTRSGTTLRVPGGGVRAGPRTGDLLATIVIDVPGTLTDAQREALDALAATLPNPRLTEEPQR